METEEVLASGKYERIGEKEAFITHKACGKKVTIEHIAMDHTEAIDFTSDFYWIDDYAMTAEKEILQITGKQDSLILANAYEDDILDIMKRLSVV